MSDYNYQYIDSSDKLLLLQVRIKQYEELIYNLELSNAEINAITPVDQGTLAKNLKEAEDAQLRINALNLMVKSLQTNT